MPMCTTGAGPAAALLGSSGPTVILDANYATDTIINLADVPISNGEFVKSWTPATGPAFTSALAIAAGATDSPAWVSASGVETLGASAAVTSATPVTIPANTDCVIYVEANLGALESGLYAIGSTADNAAIVCSTGDGGSDHSVILSFADGTSNVTAVMAGRTATGVHLLRFIRASGVWSFACTGVASAAMSPTGTVSGVLAFDTLLAFGGSGTLASFSLTDMCLQKLKIWKGTSSPDTDYETANGGVL